MLYRWYLAASGAKNVTALPIAIAIARAWEESLGIASLRPGRVSGILSLNITWSVLEQRIRESDALTNLASDL